MFQINEYNKVDRLGIHVAEKGAPAHDNDYQATNKQAGFGGVQGVLASSGNMEPFARDAMLSQLFNMDSSNCFQK
jgi:hypothetical protein